MANPRKPVGVTGTDNLTKDAGYGHYGSEPNEQGNTSVREPGRPGREPRQGSQRVPRVPVKAVERQWATPSYDPQTGRGYRVRDDRFAGTHDSRHDTPVSWEQVPDAGSHTAPNNTKGRTRLGRW